MTKVAIVIYSKLEGAGKSAVYRALMFADELLRGGDDVTIVFDGAGSTAWPTCSTRRTACTDLAQGGSGSAGRLRLLRQVLRRPRGPDIGGGPDADRGQGPRLAARPAPRRPSDHHLLTPPHSSSVGDDHVPPSLRPAGTTTMAKTALPALSPEARGMMLGAAAATIWGLYLALARQGISAGLTPVDIAAFRYVTAGLVMLPWLVVAWPEVRAVGLWRSLALAALAGPPFILLGVGGYQFAPLAHGAVVQPATVTVLGMILATLVLGEALTRARILGTTIIVAGIAVIAGPGLLTGGGLTPLGDAMFAGAGVLWAGFTLLSRRWKVPPVAGTAIVSVISGAVTLPWALASHGVAHYASLPSARSPRRCSSRVS